MPKKSVAPKKKSASKKKPAPKKAAATVKKSAGTPKPIKATLNKSGLLAYLSEQSGVEAKAVRRVLASLESAIVGSVTKAGAGAFVLPGFLKIQTQKVAAKPKRKGINPFTGVEQWFAAKPASIKIKVRALRKLKNAAG
jgi:nucleoid DNA-binding protein